MTTYIMLLNWTDQGVKTVRDSPKRLDAARKQLASMGGSFKEFYLTMGEYDMVAVCEAPDDAAGWASDIRNVINATRGGRKGSGS